MNAIEIVSGLHNYLSLLTEIERQEQAVRKEIRNPFSQSVSLRHNVITAKLSYKREDETNVLDYCIVTLLVEEQNVSIKNVACENSERETAIRDCVLQHMPEAFPSTNTTTLNEELVQYLHITDEIAKQAYLCSMGDDYFPGYFSEIIITKDEIILKQINHWNARSVAHKNDYYLRELEFRIPDSVKESKLSFGAEKIGRMTVGFSDRSSKENRTCGDKILSEIEKQKYLFERQRNS